jgi:hypothetical protein
VELLREAEEEAILATAILTVITASITLYIGIICISDIAGSADITHNTAVMATFFSVFITGFVINSSLSLPLQPSLALPSWASPSSAPLSLAL